MNSMRSSRARSSRAKEALNPATQDRAFFRVSAVDGRRTHMC